VTRLPSRAAAGRLVLAAPLLCLMALGACKGKTYTCSIYGTLGGQRILLRMVEVKSREECVRLADEL
jgi:hypothetical protein